MKKIIAYIIMCLGTVPMFSQVTTPLSEEGAGVRLLSLSQLKDSALHSNIAIRTARLDIDAAQQQRKEAFTNYFPNVSGTGLWFNANRGMASMDINPSEMISPELGATLGQMLPAEVLAALGSPISMSMMKNGTIGSLTAVQPLFAGGQIVNGNHLAKVGEDVSRLQLQLAENEVLKQTEQYYWQLVSMQQKMTTIDAVDTLLAEICKDVEVAVRAGVAVRNDLLQVQLRRNDIESQRVKLQNGIFIVKQLLGQYAGLNPSSLNPSSLTPSSLTPSPSPRGEGSIYNFDIVIPEIGQQDILLPSPIGEGQGMRSLGLLPEYQLLQKQVEAADLQRRMEVGKNLPSLGIGAGYNYHTLLDNDHTFGMVFATVSLPLSGWWGGSHAIKRRKIQQQKAQELLTDNSQLLMIRMQKAWNDVVEAHQQLAIARRSIEQAEENLRLHRNYYQAGTCRMSDLLEAQLLYQQACDRHTDACADYQNKLLEYHQATGQ